MSRLTLAAGLVLTLTAMLPWRPTALAAPQAESARWGRLSLTPIVISPPLEYIPAKLGPTRPTVWRFPGVTLDRLTDILTGAGFTPDDVAKLRALARPDPGTGGFALAPGADVIRSMRPDVRARLYLELSRSPLNFDQQTAFRFYTTSPDDWLGGDFSPDTRALIDPLIYREDDFLFLADLESVRQQIGQGPEFARLLKRLLRQSTMIVTLHVDAAKDVDRLVEYWGVGGRRTDIRPLLESVADGNQDQHIDITHLLPELARRLLYRYPKVTIADLEKPQLANCFWTALNFFNDVPDDRYLDPEIAMRRLKQDYFLVQDELQLGDIVAFSDRTGNIFHVAVYLADDLVFTKNGFFSLAPWTILPVDRLKGHFIEHADDWNVTYYRRKDL
jgi:hypothetical protein